MTMRPGALFLAILTTLALRGPGSAQEPSSQTLSVDDVIDMAQVSSPRLSPDGTRVLFTKRELDWNENERNGRIWIVSMDGTGARLFTGSDDDQNPEWSPDGRWVSFTRPVGEGDDRTRQIFLLPTDGRKIVATR
jgi:dipeptidyl aminopeptidase/acylaminoacyl peptidase